MVQATSATLVIYRSWSRQCLHDSECEFVRECDRCFHGEHNRHIQSKDFDHNQNMVSRMTWTSTCRDLDVMKKKFKCKDSHELMGWTRVCAIIKWNSSGETQKLVQAKILEGSCSCYKTWWHTGRTPASLFWFFASTGPWSFREYWIAMQVNLVLPLTPWTYMVHPLPTQLNTIKSSAWTSVFRIWER